MLVQQFKTLTSSLLCLLQMTSPEALCVLLVMMTGASPGVIFRHQHEGQLQNGQTGKSCCASTAASGHSSYGML